MQSVQTDFTKLLGVKSPIVVAPMTFACGAALATQVSLAGGFGFMAAGHLSPDDLSSELILARSLLGAAEGAPLCIGSGFLVFQLEKNVAQGEELLKMTCDAQVQAIWLAFGEDIGRWVHFIRSIDPNAGTQAAIKIFVQLSTVEHVLRAVNDWKVDAIVAQGNEAGGHGLSTSLPIITLLPLLKRTIETAGSGGQPLPLLLGAGGVATGEQVASLLALGATGVVIGTRFCLCPESLCTGKQREVLVEAKSSESVRSMAFDLAMNRPGWPQGIDGRALRNIYLGNVIDYESGVGINTLRSRYKGGVKIGDPAREIVWAGSGVGLMKSIKPAQETLRELHEECLISLMKLSTFTLKQ
ncbi:hypothetical protein CPB83DRAFT_851081 [Crepidotus variabilis]|uniref:2-nitropropane dioxygenase n=1 Tax=Crepidotus variabilis TaxID=179855 RepID=A0A9P6EJR9_9AGAR|nr:hypothetical protein CPB83DRAFT_851081 [Crepidotus variabilis]